MSEVVIVANAFGADAIRRDGHEAWLEVVARSGAAAFEVRRELFASDAQAGLPALRALGEAIRASGMWSVYSTPAELYTAAGEFDEAALRLALAEADALGARLVKLQLGGFGNDARYAGNADKSYSASSAEVPGNFNSTAGTTQTARADGAKIASCVRGSTARLVVENGQLQEGGLVAQFVGLFEALQREDYADVLGMTFDMGNWQWPGEIPLDAARLLAAHVEYIHCKAVTGEGARRFAVAPAADDPLCTEVLQMLPRDVPRGIEFPFDPNRFAADAAHYVAWLAAA
ncbi:sugar phosphate isomerase/epimerase [Paraburkholderia sp. EB58]|jgi:sugar phosphate isomerase/epimerase|uniref:sugar phosphate isomerase/epimerase n=1 Tax=Paraburkholderia sp. EB58 TaxID=3035125 RepID=UPI003D1D6573